MAKERLTDAEQRMLGRLLRLKEPLSVALLSTADFRTCRRLERRGFALSDGGRFRLSREGGEQAFLHGIAPRETV
jgi:hypothetical protein